LSFDLSNCYLFPKTTDKGTLICFNHQTKCKLSLNLSGNLLFSALYPPLAMALKQLKSNNIMSKAQGRKKAAGFLGACSFGYLDW
jgi:hypothetical protein